MTGLPPDTAAARPLRCDDIEVQWLLAGNRTQTRSTAGLTSLEARGFTEHIGARIWAWRRFSTNEDIEIKCPFGKVGDLLWVQEAHRVEPCAGPVYRASTPGIQSEKGAWSPASSMARSHSRITLRLTSVRLELLHEMDRVDAYKCGISLHTHDGYWTALGAPIPEGQDYTYYYATDPLESFKRFCAIHEGYSYWASNRWVWVLNHEAILENVDSVLTRGIAAPYSPIRSTAQPPRFITLQNP